MNKSAKELLLLVFIAALATVAFTTWALAGIDFREIGDQTMIVKDLPITSTRVAVEGVSAFSAGVALMYYLGERRKRRAR